MKQLWFYCFVYDSMEAECSAFGISDPVSEKIVWDILCIPWDYDQDFVFWTWEK